MEIDIQSDFNLATQNPVFCLKNIKNLMEENCWKPNTQVHILYLHIIYQFLCSICLQVQT